MEKGKKGFESVDEYIGTFPSGVRKKLSELRKIIRKEVPEAQEKISYQIPTFFLNGNLVHFAAYAKHIGFYPAPGATKAFQKKLAKYRHSKATVRFPLGEPLPAGLIRQMVRFRVAEHTQKRKR